MHWTVVWTKIFYQNTRQQAQKPGALKPCRKGIYSISVSFIVANCLSALWALEWGIFFELSTTISAVTTDFRYSLLCPIPMLTWLPWLECSSVDPRLFCGGARSSQSSVLNDLFVLLTQLMLSYSWLAVLPCASIGPDHSVDFAPGKRQNESVVHILHFILGLKQWFPNENFFHISERIITKNPLCYKIATQSVMNH